MRTSGAAMLVRNPSYNLMTFTVRDGRVGDSPFGSVQDPRPLAEPGAIFQAADPATNEIFVWQVAGHTPGSGIAQCARMKWSES